MKNQYILLMAVILCLMAAETSRASTMQSGVRTIFCGSLPFSKQESISVSVWDNTDLIQPSRTFDTQCVDGQFKLELYLKTSCQLTIIIGDEYLGAGEGIGETGYLVIIEPGDSLHMTVPQRSSTLSNDVWFSGKGSQRQIVLDGINQKLKEMIHERLVKQVWDTQARLEFSLAGKAMVKSELDRHRNELTERSYTELKGRCVSIFHFSNAQSAFYDDSPGSQSRQLYHELIVPNSPVEDMLVAPDRMPTTMDLEMRALIEDAIKRNVTLNTQDRKNYDLMYNLLKTYYGGKPYESYILANFIISNAKRKGWTADIDKIALHYISETKPSDPYALQVVTFRTQLKDLKAADARQLSGLIDSTGRERNLKEFRGKVVLLDFMFNGCSGCFDLVPTMDEIHKKYEGKEIEFVSISVDKSMSRFKKGIGKFSSAHSTALYTGGKGSEHDLVKHYAIILYPGLVLLGKQGELISVRAPDPRIPEGKAALMALIDNALK